MEKYSEGSFEEATEEKLPSALSAIKHDEDPNDHKNSKWAFETLGHFDFGACGDEALGDCGILWKVSKHMPPQTILLASMFYSIYMIQSLTQTNHLLKS